MSIIAKPFSIDRTRAQSLHGQVMIEFSLATVGVVVLALVIGQVTGWIDRTIVTRNDNYQATRLAAGQTATAGQDFNPPVAGTIATEQLHLIGPAAESTAGLPPVPRTTYNFTCATGANDIQTAKDHRTTAKTLWDQAVSSRQTAYDDWNGYFNGIWMVDGIKTRIDNANAEYGDGANIQSLTDAINGLNSTITDLQNQINALGDCQRTDCGSPSCGDPLNPTCCAGEWQSGGSCCHNFTDSGCEDQKNTLTSQMNDDITTRDQDQTALDSAVSAAQAKWGTGDPTTLENNAQTLYDGDGSPGYPSVTALAAQADTAIRAAYGNSSQITSNLAQAEDYERKALVDCSTK